MYCIFGRIYYVFGSHLLNLLAHIIHLLQKNCSMKVGLPYQQESRHSAGIAQAIVMIIRDKGRFKKAALDQRCSSQPSVQSLFSLRLLPYPCNLFLVRPVAIFLAKADFLFKELSEPLFDTIPADSIEHDKPNSANCHQTDDPPNRPRCTAPRGLPLAVPAPRLPDVPVITWAMHPPLMVAPLAALSSEFLCVPNSIKMLRGARS